MHSADAQRKVRVGYLPQRAAFQEWRTAEQALNTLGRLSGLEGERLEQRVDEVLEQLGIEEFRSRKVDKLSGGTLQKLGFAQAILHEPTVLVLDEPMAALDPASRFLFKKIIRELRASGTTILFSSHILSDIEGRIWPIWSASSRAGRSATPGRSRAWRRWSPSAPSWWSS